MTMNEARAALAVPAAVANNNCVQDAQARLREALQLAGKFHGEAEAAPDFVLERVRWLKNWVAAV